MTTNAFSGTVKVHHGLSREQVAKKQWAFRLKFLETLIDAGRDPVAFTGLSDKWWPLTAKEHA